METRLLGDQLDEGVVGLGFERGHVGIRGDALLVVPSGLELGGWHVADGAVKSSVVELVGPDQRGQLDVFDGSPWPEVVGVVDDFCLVEPVEGFGHGVVVPPMRKKNR